METSTRPIESEIRRQARIPRNVTRKGSVRHPKRGAHALTRPRAPDIRCALREVGQPERWVGRVATCFWAAPAARRLILDGREVPLALLGLRRSWRLRAALAMAVGLLLLQVAPAGAVVRHGPPPTRAKVRGNTEMRVTDWYPGQSVNGFIADPSNPFDPVADGYPAQGTDDGGPYEERGLRWRHPRHAARRRGAS